MGRRGSILSPAVAFGVAALLGMINEGCGRPVPVTDWTCDFDASESRPLEDPDASSPDGGVPPAECQTTCGPPVTSCGRTTLEGGIPAAVCPVCTF
jgi:hypothetical protein